MCKHGDHMLASSGTAAIAQLHKLRGCSQIQRMSTSRRTSIASLASGAELPRADTRDGLISGGAGGT
jgi:hypothetical protein